MINLKGCKMTRTKRIKDTYGQTLRVVGRIGVLHTSVKGAQYICLLFSKFLVIISLKHIDKQIMHEHVNAVSRLYFISNCELIN